MVKTTSPVKPCWSFDISVTVSESLYFQAETHLVFPKSASVEQLKLIRESIAAERDQRLRRERPVQPTAQPAAAIAAAPETSVVASAQPTSLVKMFSVIH